MIVVKSVYDRADQGGSERGSESGCCERVGGAVRRGEVRSEVGVGGGSECGWVCRETAPGCCRRQRERETERVSRADAGYGWSTGQATRGGAAGAISDDAKEETVAVGEGSSRGAEYGIVGSQVRSQVGSRQKEKCLVLSFDLLACRSGLV